MVMTMMRILGMIYDDDDCWCGGWDLMMDELLGAGWVGCWMKIDMNIMMMIEYCG